MRETRRASALPILLLLCLLATGCAWFKPDRPATWMLKGEGLADLAPAAAPSDPSKPSLPWQAETLRASAWRVIPEPGDDTTPGVLHAAALLDARDEARQALRTRLEALPVSGDRTLAQLAAETPSIARAAEASWRGADQTLLEEPDSRKLTVELALDAAPLAGVVLAHGAGFTPDPVAARDADAAREAEAQRLALSRAQRDLAGQITQLPLDRRTSVGKRLARDPRMGRAADGLMRTARVVLSERTRDNRWRVVLEVDVVPLLEWADDNPEPEPRK